MWEDDLPLDLTKQYEEEAQLAENISYLAHLGQKDNQGVDYIRHPAEVASKVPLRSKAVAWLHDTIEDAGSVEKEIVIAKLIRQSFSLRVRQAVYLLTKLPTDRYKHYIARIANSGNYDAIVVKLADLNHNMRPGGNPEKQQREYVPAIRLLTEKLQELDEHA